MKKPTLTRRSFFGALATAIAGVAIAGTISNNTPKGIDIHELFDNGFQTMQGATLKEHLALIDKINDSGILRSDLKAHHIANVARYFVSTPDVAAMHLWNTFAKGKVSNAIALHQTRFNDKSPSQTLREIITDNQRLSHVKEKLS